MKVIEAESGPAECFTKGQVTMVKKGTMKSVNQKLKMKSESNWG